MLYCMQGPHILNRQSISFDGIFPLIFMTVIHLSSKLVGISSVLEWIINVNCAECALSPAFLSPLTCKNTRQLYIHQSISTPDLWAVSSLQRNERKIQRNNDIRVTEDDIDKLREIRGVLLASLVPHPMNSQTVKWQRQEIPDATVSTWRLYYEASLIQ